MRVFVTGSTGFIGFAVASAFARAGHDVTGLARSAEKAVRLSAAEVLPVIGSLEDPKSYADAARAAEVLIHCASDPKRGDFDMHAISSLLGFCRDARLPRKFIYTSGVWVYGDTGDRLVDESSRLAPPPLVGWRPSVEQTVLGADSDVVRTVVIRPGCVYGGAGSLTAMWFEAATKEGAARVVGDGSARWAMIHLEDLADLFVRAAGSAFGGEIFNATDRSRFTVLECARAASLAVGVTAPVECVPLEEASKQLGPFAQCLALSQHVDSRKAAALLGWQPRHSGFVDRVVRYHAAFRALAKP
jgi:nucleoside-diphosphate-sugar epimerase